MKLQIQQAVNEMAYSLSEKFITVQTPIYQIACRRNNQCTEEQIFVVARVGNKIIVFDDVEDEFGVAELSSETDNILQRWDLFGTLENALKAL